MIRPATREDRPALIKLLQECDLYNPDLDYSEWSHPTLVAEEDGEVVGMCQVMHGRPYAYMSEICVRPSHQDRGLASQMILAHEEILRECGIPAWGGLAVATNKNSIARMVHLGGVLHKTGYVYVRTL